MSVTIYHNPRCSKSRATLALLTERNLDIQIIEYLKMDFSIEQLIEVYQQLNLSNVRDMMRTGDELYKELQLANQALSDQELLQAIVNHPSLLERPIVVHKKQARLGRPPEKVLEIL